MKKILLVLFLSSACLLSAQSKFEIGIVSGAELNFASSFNKENIKDYEATPGFNIGVRLRRNWGMCSLIGGLEYGRVNVFLHEEPNSDAAFNMGYQKRTLLIGHQARLPILFQLNVGKKKSQFFVNTGPCIILTAHDDDTRTFGDTYYTGYPKFIQPIDMAGMLGAGYSYKVNDWLRLFSEARLTIPFAIGNSDSNTTRNLTLSWQLGVSFTTKGNKDNQSSLNSKDSL